MSLPSGLSNSQEYFKKCLKFLSKYSWIYETSNTCFVRDKVLNKMPLDCKTYFTTVTNDDLNKFPSRQLKTNHSNLDEFIQELNHLTPHKSHSMAFPNENYTFKKMSKKKQHEIARLSRLIKNLCSKDIDVLVDFGSGLGYLSEVLHKENAYKIIGIESDLQRVQTSKERQATTYPSSKNDVMFMEHFITEDSNEFILNQVESLFPKLKYPQLALIGLHSCADLTINSMKLFLTMSNVQKLIIMPCCYHKLETKNDNCASGFKNFPLSDTLKSTSPTLTVFNRPFLRLACQQTFARWVKQSEKEHHDHGLDMFFRGVAEALISDEEIVVKKNRKMIFEEFDFDELKCCYELRSRKTKEPITWTTEHRERFIKLMDEYPNGPKLAEGLTCLQTSMQELFENIVLYDRLCYMDEQAAEMNLKISLKFEKIMDEELSPRCYVLIAQKL